MDSFKPSSASTHNPLQTDEIRLVTLHPGSSDDLICCTFEHIDLEKARNDYIALSYTWGDPTQTEDISLNGHTYPVTLSLRSALSYLRRKDEARRFWIDSICINQRDMAERSAQVGRMRDIFAYAAEVHIWLGDYGPDHTEDEWRRAIAFVKPNEKGEIKRDPDDSALYMACYGMMSTLYTRPWFSRMWVIQEVAVRTWEEDHERVKFLLGHINVPYSVMSKEHGGWAPQAYIDVHQRVDDPENIRGCKPKTGYPRLVRNGLHNINHAWCVLQKMCAQDPTARTWPTSIQLSYLLSTFSEFKATEPRDRLYALIGLLYGSKNMQLPAHLLPDYSKPRDDVFHEYAVWILQQMGVIDILSLNTGPRTGRTCPSWVPNFEGRRKNFEDACINTRGPFPVRLLENNQVLEADALMIGLVEMVSEPLKVDETPRITSALVQKAREMLLRWESWIKFRMDITPTSYDEAWPRTQLSGYFDQAYKESERAHGRVNLPKGELYNALFCDKPEKDPRFSQSVLSYADFILNEFEGLAPFMDGHGDIEFCSSKSEIPQFKDVLCLLRGSSKQFILRQAPPGSLGDWTMVGTTYNDADKTSLYRSVKKPLTSSSPGQPDYLAFLDDFFEEFLESLGAPKPYKKIWERYKEDIFKVRIC